MQCNRTECAVRLLLWVSFGCICATTFSQNTSVKPGSSESGASKSGSSKSGSALVTAKAEISKGELGRAEEKLWTVLSSDPNQSEALTLLGIIRGRQKRYAEAEALLRRVLQLDPKSVAAHRNLANVLSAQN